MKCRDIDLIWEDCIVHWRNTNFEHDSKHPPLVGWVMLISKRLVSHLQIYDMGQQEARLRWLLLKEFGQHVTYPTLKGMLLVWIWHDTCIMGKQGFWVHCDDVAFFM